MEQISRVPFGVVVLWLIVLGLAALGIWRIAEAFLERDPDSKKPWGHRVKEIGTALAYFAIAATALVYALGGRSDSSQSTTTFSAPAARDAGWRRAPRPDRPRHPRRRRRVRAMRGIRTDFEKQLTLPAGKVGERRPRVRPSSGTWRRASPSRSSACCSSSRRFTHDPEKAGGLDSALKSLAELPFGQVILWLVRSGPSSVYGAYCSRAATRVDTRALTISPGTGEPRSPRRSAPCARRPWRGPRPRPGRRRRRGRRSRSSARR